MDKKSAFLLGAFSLSLCSCLSDSGVARIHRKSPAMAAIDQLAVPERVQTVRASYGLHDMLPSRPAPYYFCEAQHLGAESLPADTKINYEQFCRHSTYPHTLNTWINKGLLSAKGKRQITIALAAQRGLLFVNNQLAMDFPVCTGSPSRPTPTGSFEVLEKDRHHHSNLYDHAPMHCFMRLTWDGIGMHIGPMAGKPASHGCIRLPEQAARSLYACVPLGTPVQIMQ